MSQKTTQTQKVSSTKQVPLKARKVVAAISPVPFLGADEFMRRRQTGPLSRYVE